MSLLLTADRRSRNDPHGFGSCHSGARRNPVKTIAIYSYIKHYQTSPLDFKATPLIPPLDFKGRLGGV